LDQEQKLKEAFGTAIGGGAPMTVSPSA
jgi:hypothetical protein